VYLEEFQTLVKDHKHLVFDFGGIFINISYQKMLQSLSDLSGKEIHKDFFNQTIQDSLFSEFEMGKIDEHEFTLRISAKLNIKHNHQKIVDAWNSILFDIPKERIEMLSKLEGKKLYLLSNINSIHARYIENYLNKEKISFYDHFEKIYFSHEIRMRKPNEDIFQYVLSDNKLKAEEVFFIDDSLQHVEAARKIGIHSYHLKEQNSLIVTFALP
jgi:putative hydrolase of the HAD superfamily